VNAFANGYHELMVIVGDGGVGKSETVNRTMQAVYGGRGWSLVKGKCTPLALYQKLYQSRLVPIVLDDLDALLKNHDNTALLKCVCDTSPVKRVEWSSSHRAFRNEENSLPTSFESISRVLVISNDWKTLNKNVAALQNRGVLIFFSPTAIEVHRELARGGWFDDRDVFQFIAKNLFLVSRPSFRFYLTGKNHRESGLNWQDLILRMMEGDVDSKLTLVARLLADSHYDDLKAPEAARLRAFKRLDGGSRASYFRYKQQLLERRGEFDFATVDEIELQPRTIDPQSMAILDRRRQLEAMRDESEIPVSEYEAVLPNMQRKVTVRTQPSDPVSIVIAELDEEMRRLTAKEEYEMAAKLRDVISHLADNR
jgi:hypothetical protein